MAAKDYVLDRSIWVPYPLEEVFAFFSDASNLPKLTPPWVHIEIRTPRPIEMKPGTLIEYRMRLYGIPFGWLTEIKTWDPPHSFSDIQLRGPYRVWDHTHSFEAKDGGTLCHDHVVYRPHGGWLTNALFVRRDVERMFAYRTKALEKLLAQELGPKQK